MALHSYGQHHGWGAILPWWLVNPENQRLSSNDWRCSTSDRPHQPLEISNGAGSGGTCDAKYKLVKTAGPDDLVFQSVQQGKAMNDQNVLRRHIKPAAKSLGLSFVNWRCLRTSHATWLVQAGADAKSVQGQCGTRAFRPRWTFTRRLFRLRNSERLNSFRISQK
jgi:hypothetical protein